MHFSNCNQLFIVWLDFGKKEVNTTRHRHGLVNICERWFSSFGTRYQHRRRKEPTPVANEATPKSSRAAAVRRNLRRVFVRRSIGADGRPVAPPAALGRRRSRPYVHRRNSLFLQVFLFFFYFENFSFFFCNPFPFPARATLRTGDWTTLMRWRPRKWTENVKFFFCFRNRLCRSIDLTRGTIQRLEKKIRPQRHQSIVRASSTIEERKFKLIVF